MLEEMQQVLNEVTFRGKIPTYNNPTQVDNVLTRGTVTVHFSPEAHKVRAVSVCKIWKETFDKYLSTELRALTKDD